MDPEVGRIATFRITETREDEFELGVSRYITLGHRFSAFLVTHESAEPHVAEQRSWVDDAFGLCFGVSLESFLWFWLYPRNVTEVSFATGWLSWWLMVKNPSETRGSLRWEDPLEKGKASHSCILPWRIPMDGRAWWATVLWWPRVRHDFSNKHHQEREHGFEGAPFPLCRALRWACVV